MNIEKYTERSRGFIQSAQSLALREGHQQFQPEHLLKVLLDDPEGLAAGLITAGRRPARSSSTARIEAAALKKIPKVAGLRARARSIMAPETGARLRCQAETRRPRRRATASSPPSACCWRWRWTRAAEAADALAKRQTSSRRRSRSAIQDLRKGRTADSASAENSRMTR